MKKLLLLITALLMVVCSFAQTQNGHIFYQDEGNTYSYGRNVLFRTDHTNLDTLTSVVTGTIAFDTVNEVVVFYNGGTWKDLASDTISIWETSGNYIYPDTIGDSLGIGTNTPTGILSVIDDDSTKVIVGDAELTVNGSPTTTNGFSATRYGDGTFVHVVSAGRGSIYESFIASIDTSTGFTNSINTDTLGAEMVSGLSGSSKYNRFKVDTTDGAFIELPFAATDFYVENASSQKVLEYDQSDAELTIENADLKYVDGNQGLNKHLVSDANGVASWATDTVTTGWVTYVDTTYPNSGSAWTLTGGADTKLDFSWGTKNDTYLPLGIDSLFSRVDSTIIGIDGMGLDIMLYFRAVPSSASQWVDLWIDIGGGVGELYRQTFSFPKGAGVERGILYSLPSAYTLSTWESNGGTIYIRSDSNLDIYGINLNMDVEYQP